VYDTSNEVITFSKFNGYLQPTADIELVCASYCKHGDQYNCWDYSMCPLKDWAGTVDSSSSYSGISSVLDKVYDIANTSVFDTYQYKWDLATYQIQSYQDNSGTSIAGVDVDARSSVTYTQYSGCSSPSCYPAMRFEMYPGSDPTAYDSLNKIDEYLATSGNIYYEVSIGKQYSHQGWSFFAEDTSNNPVVFSGPIQCAVTVPALDRNGDDIYAGTSWNLLIGGQVSGLSWYDMTINGETQYVQAPQFPDGQECGSDYVLKAASVTSFMTNTDVSNCASHDTSLAAVLALPSTFQYPSNKDDVLPANIWDGMPSSHCVNMKSLMSGTEGCIFRDGWTSTEG